MNEEFSKIIDSFIIWLPKLFLAIVILIIGWIVALILASIVESALKSTGINHRLREMHGADFLRKLTTNPAHSISRVVYWLVWLVAITILIGVLNIPYFEGLIARVYAYIPNLIGAIFIFFVALGFSTFISGVILRWMGETATGKIVATIIPILVMSIASFAILEQLKIAPVIIETTYIALMGALSLGLALAFGLGGREVAARILDNAYRSGTQNYDRMREDVRLGQRKAREDAERAKEKFRSERREREERDERR